MRRGAHLDPFSARLLSIHQKPRTFNPPPHEEHDAQGVLGGDREEKGTQAVGECAGAGEEPVLDLAPVGAVDTGCADCGGMGASSPVAELRQELSEMKARMAALEARIADLEDGDKAVYRSV